MSRPIQEVYTGSVFSDVAKAPRKCIDCSASIEKGVSCLSVEVLRVGFGISRRSLCVTCGILELEARIARLKTTMEVLQRPTTKPLLRAAGRA